MLKGIINMHLIKKLYLRSENSAIIYAQFVVSNIIAGQCYICEKQRW
jgi:hypothetical protein